MNRQRTRVAAAASAAVEAGTRAVLATVVSCVGSAPRGVGAQLLITADGAMVGALTGGCTEGAVLDEARRMLDEQHDGAVATMLTFSKRTIDDVGPACGSVIAVMVEQVSETLALHLARINEATTGGSHVLERRAWTLAAATGLETADTRTHGTPLRAELEFLDTFVAPEDARVDGDHLHVSWSHEPVMTLVLGGAGDITAALIEQAACLGWRTHVIDPRTDVLQRMLNSLQPDEVTSGWPDTAHARGGSSTAWIALSHEQHIDEPFLTAAIAADAGYIGAVGSRKVQAAHRDYLARHHGESAAAALRGPAGLDLGGTGAEEIAASIVAEVLAARYGRTGRPLRDTDGAIRAR